MPIVTRILAIGYVTLVSCASAASFSCPSGSIDPVPLSSTAPCEPSAILLAPWNQVVVADNEEDERLFSFRRDEGGLHATGTLEVVDGDELPKDIEALAVLRDQVLVVGSQSRNKKCEPKEKRLSIVIATRNEAGRLVQSSRISGKGSIGKLRSNEGSCTGLLFPTEGATGIADAACKAIEAAEKEADAQATDEDRCQETSLNIEGAAVLGDGQSARLWVGLRSPLLEDGRAILLRVADLGAAATLTFDRAVAVDLGRRGIRSLTADGDDLWGIAGPAGKGRGDAAIWRMKRTDLDDASSVAPTCVAGGLDAASEGLLLTETHAVVVVDGREPADGGATCEVPSRQYSLPRAITRGHR